MAEKKRRAKGSGSLRKVTKNGNIYWEATVTVGYDPGTNKQIRRTFSGKKQGDVLKRMQAASVAVENGTYFEPGKLTVKQWFETWLTDYMAAVKPLTVQQYRSMSETHIYPVLGSVKLCKLTAPQLQKFFNQLAIDGKKQRRKNQETGEMETVSTGEPLSAKSIRNIYDIMSKSFNTAIQQGVLKESVLQRVTIPKVIHEEVKPLTEEQQRAFFKAIQGHDFRTLYTLAIFTGLREGETIGLTWDCIDFQKGTLKVYRQLQRTPGKWSEWRFVPLKNSKSRTIKLSPYILTLLQQHKTAQQAARIAAGKYWQGFGTLEEQEADFVFLDALGSHLNAATVYENFKKIADQIGAPEARFHDLRHTFAVNCLQCGDNPKTVQEALGHATAAFTLNVYGHVSERMMEEHAARQQEYIKALGL